VARTNAGAWLTVGFGEIGAMSRTPSPILGWSRQVHGGSVRRRISGALCSLVAAAVLLSCSGAAAPPTSPLAVAQRFEQAMANGDGATVASLISADFSPGGTQTKVQFLSMLDGRPLYRLASLAVLAQPTESGSVAVVQFEKCLEGGLVGGAQTQVVSDQLERQPDGTWLVSSLTLSTAQNIGSACPS